jgi:hypothetical protein
VDEDDNGEDGSVGDDDDSSEVESEEEDDVSSYFFELSSSRNSSNFPKYICFVHPQDSSDEEELGTAVSLLKRKLDFECLQIKKTLPSDLLLLIFLYADLRHCWGQKY